MTKAGIVATIALVGLTLASGMALGDVLPPLPPAPTLPAFPNLPAIPAPNLPVRYQECVAIANEAGGETGRAMTVLRDGSVNAFQHQSAATQVYLEASSAALALEDAASQASGIYASGLQALNVTLLDTSAAINFTSKGLSASMNQTSDGLSNATSGTANGTGNVANETVLWSQRTFERDWESTRGDDGLIQGSYYDLADGDVGAFLDRASDWVAFVNDGEPAPVEDLYDSMAQSQANATDAAFAIYGIPALGAEGFEMAFASASGYLNQVAGIAVRPGSPAELAALTEDAAMGMTAMAQQDAGALAGSLDGTASFTRAWTLGLPARAPGCARVG